MSKTIIKIFDPPMCCSTGICGPTIDPKLIKVNELFMKFKRDYPETVDIQRHMVGKDVLALQKSPEVLELIRVNGTKVLPITTVNGKVIKTNQYPTFEELIQLIDVSK